MLILLYLKKTKFKVLKKFHVKVGFGFFAFGRLRAYKNLLLSLFCCTYVLLHTTSIQYLKLRNTFLTTAF